MKKFKLPKIKPQFIYSASGKKKYVFMSYVDYQKLLNAIQKLQESVQKYKRVYGKAPN